MFRHASNAFLTHWAPRPPHRQQDRVEAARRSPRQTREILLRGADDALLLTVIDAGRRSAEIRVAAQAYLDKHQRPAILHDQVNLPITATVIALDQLQALLLQEVRSPLLGFLAPACHGVRITCEGNIWIVGPLSAPTSCERPSWKRAGVATRWNTWSRR